MVKYMGIVTGAIEAVKENGYALQYVKEQSEAVCLAAVKEDGHALQYVIDIELFKSISIKLGMTDVADVRVCQCCGQEVK